MDVQIVEWNGDVVETLQLDPITCAIPDSALERLQLLRTIYAPDRLYAIVWGRATPLLSLERALISAIATGTEA